MFFIFINHRMQLILMVTNHRSNDAMLTMYRLSSRPYTLDLFCISLFQSNCVLVCVVPGIQHWLVLFLASSIGYQAGATVGRCLGNKCGSFPYLGHSSS